MPGPEPDDGEMIAPPSTSTVREVAMRASLDDMGVGLGPDSTTWVVNHGVIQLARVRQPTDADYDSAAARAWVQHRIQGMF